MASAVDMARASAPRVNCDDLSAVYAGTRRTAAGIELDGDRLWRLHPDWIDTDGLVERWSFEGPLGAVAGSCIEEQVQGGCGYANPELQPSVAYVPGRIDHAASFSGVPDGYIVGLRTQLPTERSASAWVRFHAAHLGAGGGEDDMIFLVERNDASPGSGMFVSREDELGYFRASGDTGPQWPRSYVQTQTVGVPGRWHHVATVMTRTSVRLYVNGELEVTRMLDASEELTPLDGFATIGGGPYAVGVDAVLDELTIWNRALSIEEIREIRTHQTPPFRGAYESTTCATRATTTSMQLQMITSETQRPRVDRSGLVATWPLNGARGSVADGTPLADVSGAGRTAVARNANGAGMAIVDGPIADALELDGIDDHLVVDPIAGVTDASFAAWVRVAAPGAVQPIVSVGGTRILAVSAAGRLELTSPPVVFEGGTRVADDSWHHVVVTHDRADQATRMYIDGRLELNVSPTTFSFDTQLPILIGSDGTSLLGGMFDEISIWQRVLGPDEIDALYQFGVHRVALQVRACPTIECAGVVFVGPDGTAATSFATDTYDFNQGPAVFPIRPPSASFVQWRAALSTLRTQSGPILESVSVVAE